jgi:tyrosine phenol-lyase
MPHPMEPYKIKMVEPLGWTSPQERRRVLEEAGYNVFRIPADKVLIDLLTDSGTGAMSARQWSALLCGDEAYAGSSSFFVFEAAVREVTGFEHVIPTHQGRAAESLLFEALVRPGDTVPNNTHFDTTRANVEYRQAAAADCPSEAAARPAVLDLFKGNMDVQRLESLIKRYGRERIPLAMMTVTNNSVGGQPVSLANLREVRKLLDAYGIPLFLDAGRFAENAYLVREREPGQAGRRVAEIAREMFALADGCTMSAKKDGLVNIGGLIGLRDGDLAKRIQALMIRGEGFPTYGGLAGRDLEAIAVGLREVLDERLLEHRTGQVRYLAERLEASGVPTVRPPGGHAVFVDAAAFLPHVPAQEFPGQTLACELYLEGGIRGVEVGSFMFGGHPADGRPELELLRLCVPWRVYTESHFSYVAEVFARLRERRDRIGGLRIVEEPPVLRHFTARLAPISDASPRS